MRLSTNLDELQPEYDAIVVGSGYGGGVAASRLARIGLKVAVLERGREFATRRLPRHDAGGDRGAAVHDRRPSPRAADRPLRSPSRARHARVTGCGLGGGSLINANVSLPPDPRVWEDPRWPSAILAEGTLEEGFQRATRMLRPVPYPEYGAARQARPARGGGDGDRGRDDARRRSMSHFERGRTRPASSSRRAPAAATAVRAATSAPRIPCR